MKSVEVKSVEVKSVEVESVEVKSVEVKSAEVKSVEASVNKVASVVFGGLVQENPAQPLHQNSLLWLPMSTPSSHLPMTRAFNFGFVNSHAILQVHDIGEPG